MVTGLGWDHWQGDHWAGASISLVTGGRPRPASGGKFAGKLAEFRDLFTWIYLIKLARMSGQDIRMSVQDK